MDYDRYQFEQRRKETSRKSMYFNRFLSIRYCTALFFVINLFWLIALFMSNSVIAIVPGILLVAIVGVLAEQSRLLSVHSNQLPFARGYYLLQLAANIALMICSFTSLFKTFFPFLTDTTETKLFLDGLLFVGSVLAGLMLWKIHRISLDKDRHYARIHQYEEATL